MNRGLLCDDSLTESRLAELLKQEKYLRLLLASSPEIMMLLDREGRITYCTDTLLRLLGMSDMGEITGLTYKELYRRVSDDDFVNGAEYRFEGAKTAGKMIASDVMIDFTAGGGVRRYTVRTTPMTDEDGSFDGALVVYYDTTELRNQEAGSSARLMLSATPYACSMWDEDGNILFCNDAALSMFEIKDKDEYLRRFSEMSPEFQPDGSKSLEKMLEYDKLAFETGYQQFEWMHKTASGEALPVETTFVRVPWENGYRLAAFAVDLRQKIAAEKKVHEADERNRELEVQTRAAQVAIESKSRFLASMSHEIRTPMNVIIGMTDLMRTDNLDEGQKEFFSDIKIISRTLLQIINDILDFSKIDAGRMELVPGHFSLVEMYDNICSMSRFQAEEKELEFVSSFSEDIPAVVYGDELRVRQVIVNIVNNAIKYTRKGHVILRIERAFSDGAEYIAFVVEDTGIGIKSENFPRLFDAFQQFDSEINHGIIGTGLGLSITKTIVEMMGGRIDVWSEYGKGTRFNVLLPLPKGDYNKIEREQAENISVADGDVRVLVVDDNSINLKIAAAYLARHGIKADTAESGAAALRRIKDGKYDLIFMDHMMPEMDGLETARRILEMGGEYADTPIIALSANAVSGARETFLEAGMKDFISKPIDPIALNKALVRWLPANKMKAAAGFTDEAEHIEGRVLNREAGIEYSAGSEELYMQLLGDFPKQHGSDPALIKDAIESGDIKTAHRKAHTLKSSAAVLGADGLSKIALKTEKALAEGDIDAAMTELVDLGVSMDAVLCEIGEDIMNGDVPDIVASVCRETAALMQR
ncbi:MAG: response regulator [Clostridiales Family XIII bacterium]|jgi:PAS domain S-box-containing protein|nr:response regulator [Clostridiales Family XIII bacterium]